LTGCIQRVQSPESDSRRRGDREKESAKSLSESGEETLKNENPKIQKQKKTRKKKFPSQSNMKAFLLLLAFVAQCVSILGSMPPPFTRELKVTKPSMTGNDVLICQTLVKRDESVDPKLTADGVYGDDSAKAVSAFQASIGLKATGVFDEATANKLLELHSDDGVTDSGFTAESMGYLYKFHIPVHKNRSVETTSTLYDAKGKVMLKFTARTHGKRGDGTTAAWPDFGNGDVGLSEFASSGNTVTGLVEIDLNSPEPDPDVYGPWPINRIVRGLDGNALLCKFYFCFFLIFHEALITFYLSFF
jgi:peptidoglycan hydrolase-like protein with peptidoglycan-binding domain